MKPLLIIIFLITFSAWFLILSLFFMQLRDTTFLLSKFYTCYKYRHRIIILVDIVVNQIHSTLCGTMCVLEANRELCR